MVLGHHEDSLHPARFPDVNLARPIPVIGEFILRQAPASHKSPHFLWNSRIIGYEVAPAFLVTLVFTQDFAAALVAAFRVIVAIADIIGAKRPVIIAIGFPVRDGIEFFKAFAPTGLENAGQQLVFVWIV